MKKSIDSGGGSCYTINCSGGERDTKYGGIAQLGERLNGIQEVSGSIPLISTKRPATQVAGLFCLSAFRKHHKNRVQKLSHLPTICIRLKMLQ